MKFTYIRISSLALLFAIFLFTLFGCGEKSYPDLKIILTTSDNDPVGEVSVVAASNNGDVREFLYAGTKEIFIDNPYSDMDITVRGRGYKFFTVNVNLDKLEQEESCYKKELTLEKLQPFIKSDDFVTGFKSDAGLDEYKSLAFTADTSIGKAYAVKFYIKDVDDNPTVYFINSKKHPIHFDFVKNFVDSSINPSDYSYDTYVDPSRTAMAGTIVYYPDVAIHTERLDKQVESLFAVTYFPSDTLTPLMEKHAQMLLEERMKFADIAGYKNRLMYLPAGSNQESELDDNIDLFLNTGSRWITRQELYSNSTMQIMSSGEAYGTLRRLSPGELESEVVSFHDILILTSLPDKLPLVGGTITEELQTPLSHVNVAAMGRGTPNIALLNAGETPEIKKLIGELVHFKVEKGGYVIEKADIDDARNFWEKTKGEKIIPGGDLVSDKLLDFKDFGFYDSDKTGVKAANVSELSKIIGDYAPHGFAVPFYYYKQFMDTSYPSASLCSDAFDDCVEEGRTDSICSAAKVACENLVKQKVNMTLFVSTLIDDDDFKTNTVLREAALDLIRYLIRHISIDYDFADTLNGKITKIFKTRKVRLRSSTNCEDLQGFSGAGLYDSYSAYGSGVEKPASEQIKKVWASIWNFGAYEERDFYNIDHMSVYMGVLVHQAFPDEAANGVLITVNIADPFVDGMYVNVQKGETSVTNPENSETPEVFSIVAGNKISTVQVSRQSFSSLSPEVPVLTDDEVQLLYDTSRVVQKHFAELYKIYPWDTAPFDIEFKFHGASREFYIKQIRPFSLSSF